MGYIITLGKKFSISKYTINEKRDKILMNTKLKTIDCKNLEDIELVLPTNNIQKILNNLYFNIEDIYYSFIVESIKESLEKEIVNYIKNNNKYKVVYNFQPEYYQVKLTEKDIEKNDCVIINQGQFLPLEYENLKIFLNEPITEGTIEYDNIYKRKIFKPHRIIEKIEKNITYNEDELIDLFVKIIDTPEYFEKFNTP